MAPIVETAAGKVAGLTKDGIDSFRGVPFAASTGGANRFRAPQPAEPWVGVRDATLWGAPAPQVVDATLTGPALPREWSEDCLNLNVFTPGCDGARRPVMVWIHGGSFKSGTGATPMYAGSRLARRGDVVVVTINYRLGALGYLAHPDLADPDGGSIGNFGLRDQVAALQWVQQNIEAFGGDPTNVTVFGESAGAMSVATLLSMESTAGLFRRAIVQSGPPMSMTPDEAAEVAEQVASAAGVGVAGLRDLAAPALIAAQAAAFTGLTSETGVPFRPVVDGRVLTRSPLDGIAAGARGDAALLIGTNRDEAKLWLTMFPELMQVDDATLPARVAESLVAVAGVDIEAAIALYRRGRESRGEPTTAMELLAAIGTDAFFLAGSLRVADAHHAHQPATFLYLFTHESPAFGGMLGSCHALEIPFVFGTHNLRGADAFCAAGPDVDRLSADMQGAWLAFARSGDPSQPDLPWPAYEPDSRPTMVFGTKDSALERAPLDAEWRFWQAAGA